MERTQVTGTSLVIYRTTGYCLSGKQSLSAKIGVRVAAVRVLWR